MATEKSRIHGQKAKDAEDAASKPQQRSAEMRRFHALVRARFAACPLVRVVKLKIPRVPWSQPGESSTYWESSSPIIGPYQIKLCPGGITY